MRRRKETHTRGTPGAGLAVVVLAMPRILDLQGPGRLDVRLARSRLSDTSRCRSRGLAITVIVPTAFLNPRRPGFCVRRVRGHRQEARQCQCRPLGGVKGPRNCSSEYRGRGEWSQAHSTSTPAAVSSREKENEPLHKRREKKKERCVAHSVSNSRDVTHPSLSRGLDRTFILAGGLVFSISAAIYRIGSDRGAF